MAGFSADADPEAWKEWTMAYKGWDETKWSSEFARYQKLGKSVFSSQGIHFFDYATVSDTVSGNLVGRLDEFISNIDNVTLIGHSKGANLIMAHMQTVASGTAKNAAARYIINKAPDPDEWSSLATSSQRGLNAPFSRIVRGPFLSPTSQKPAIGGGYTPYGNGYSVANVANIYGTTDKFGNMHELAGAVNIVDNTGQVFPVIDRYVDNGHGRGSVATARAAFDALNVYVLDSQASR